MWHSKLNNRPFKFGMICYRWLRWRYDPYRICEKSPNFSYLRFSQVLKTSVNLKVQYIASCHLDAEWEYRSNLSELNYYRYALVAPRVPCEGLPFQDLAFCYFIWTSQVFSNCWRLKRIDFWFTKVCYIINKRLKNIISIISWSSTPWCFIISIMSSSTCPCLFITNFLSSSIAMVHIFGDFIWCTIP